jgi:hypothetical protein
MHMYMLYVHSACPISQTSVSDYSVCCRVAALFLQMGQSAAETRDAAMDKAAELKDKAADKAGEVRPSLRLRQARTFDGFWPLQLAVSAADDQASACSLLPLPAAFTMQLAEHVQHTEVPLLGSCATTDC